MRRLLLVLLAILLLVVLVAGGLLGFLIWQPGTLKGPIERLASGQLGQPVRIEGPLSIRPGRVTTFDASGISVAAPDWAASRTLAAIRHLRLGIDLGAYLGRRELVITELRLDGPEAALERDAQGRTSWPSAKPAPEGSRPASGKAQTAPSLPSIKALTITDGKLAYKDAVTQVDVAASLATEPPKPGATGDFGGLKLDGGGRVRGGPMTLALEVGSPLLLTQAGTPFPIKGELDLAGTHLSLDGQARDPLTLQGLTLALDLASKDPTKLLALFGQDVSQAPPDLSLKGRLSRDGSAFAVSDLAAGWGQSRLDGKLAFDPGAPRPTLTGTLHAAMLDLVALQPLMGGGGKQASTGPGPLATNDADLQLSADAVRLPGVELRDLGAGVKLASGRLTLDPLHVTLPKGAVAGQVAVADLAATPLEAALQLKADQLDLGQAASFVPALEKLAGAFTGTLAGTLRGTDAATILGKSDLTLAGELGALRYDTLASKSAKIEARLADGKLTLDPLNLALGQGALSGKAVVAGMATDALTTALDLKADKLDLAPLAAFVPAMKDLAGAFTGTLTGDLRGSTGAAIMAQSALTLAGRFAGLRYGDYAANEAALTAKLADSRLTLDPIQLVLPQGRLGGKVTSGPLDKPFTGDLGLTIDAVELNNLIKAADVGGTLSGKLTGTLRGTSVDEVLAQSVLHFAGTVDKPRLPQIEDRLGPIGFDAALQPKSEQPLLVTMTSKVKDTPLRLELRGRDLPLLLENKGTLPVALTIALGDTKASADGKLTLPFDQGRMDAALAIEGPDPGPVMALFDVPAIELPPYKLAGNLTRKGATYQLSGVTGKIGDSDIAGTLSLKLDGPRPTLAGDLHSKHLDINDLGGLVGGTPGTGPGETASAGQKAKAAEKKVEAKTEGQTLPKDQLNPSRWQQLDADIQLTADEVKAGRIPLDGFELKTALKNGLLRVEPLVLRLGEGQARGWLELDARKNPASSKLDIDLSRLPVARLLSQLKVSTGNYGTLSGRARGGASLGSEGLSVAQLLGNADGQITLLMEGGTLNRELVTALGFDLLRLFGSLLGTTPEQVQIGCAIADLTVKDGLVHTKSLAMETAVANIGGDGDINLKDETIDIGLIANPKGVAVPGGHTGIRIGGTFAAPKINVNPAQLLARGAAAATLGVFLSPLTGLASQLGIGQQQGQGPCSSMLDKAQDGDKAG